MMSYRLDSVLFATNYQKGKICEKRILVTAQARTGDLVRVRHT